MRIVARRRRFAALTRPGSRSFVGMDAAQMMENIVRAYKVQIRRRRRKIKCLRLWKGFAAVSRAFRRQRIQLPHEDTMVGRLAPDLRGIERRALIWFVNCNK